MSCATAMYAATAMCGCVCACVGVWVLSIAASATCCHGLRQSTLKTCVHITSPHLTCVLVLSPGVTSPVCPCCP